ncbi:MAG: HNH endonuclease [Nitrospirae bacterium]|nr:HNH endonuclease [Nitrospirota bacterium]
MADSSSGLIRKEREKARQLRKTGWWKRRCSIGVCYYCKGRFPPNELTMDHIIPLCRGGSSMKNNIVAACKTCNNKKKHLMSFEWDDYMSALKQSDDSMWL